MQHYILAKFKETPKDRDALREDVTDIFRGVLDVPGVRGYAVYANVIDRPNRYDLMIVIDMAEDALSRYDDCDAHHLWKAKYGEQLAAKAIFDRADTDA